MDEIVREYPWDRSLDSIAPVFVSGERWNPFWAVRTTPLLGRYRRKQRRPEHECRPRLLISFRRESSWAAFGSL